jgi:hypothetical protein
MATNFVAMYFCKSKSSAMKILKVKIRIRIQQQYKEGYGIVHSSLLFMGSWGSSGYGLDDLGSIPVRGNDGIVTLELKRQLDDCHANWGTE